MYSGNGGTAIVIGAGLGGIATAARLAHTGYEVRVFEKCEKPGGRCGSITVEGHTFDTGPTLFLMRDVFERTFADLGEKLEDHLKLKRVDPSYRIHFVDGSTFSLTSDLPSLRAQMEEIEAGSFNQLLRYLNEAEKHYQYTIDHIITRNFEHFLEYFNFRNLRLLFKLKALVKHVDYTAKYFSEPKLQEVFTFQDMYLGISPYDAPATYSLLQHVELAEGVWYPEGGMYQVVEALINIANRLGVHFEYDASVAEICTNGKTATGITLEDGRHYQADVIIANADLPYVYRHLLPDDGTCRKLERKEYSFSAITFFWGLKKRFPQFDLHNLFLSEDNRRGFDQIFHDLTLPDNPSFYIHAPIGVDPSMAPAGKDSLIVIIPVGHLNHSQPQDWKLLQDRAREVVLHRLAAIGIDDVESNLKFEVCMDPTDWHTHYNLMKGSPHGLSYSLKQVGYLRPHNQHKCYRNLYFVGASTHPGTGLPMVLISAQLTTERIMRDAVLQ